MTLTPLILLVAVFLSFCASGNSYLPVVWQHSAPAQPNDARFSQGAPAVDANGRIYIGMNMPATDNASVLAYSPNGVLLWQTALTASYQVHRVIPQQDGLLVFTNNQVFKLSYSGNVVWRYTGVASSQHVVGPDGAIYFQRNDSLLVALNPNGSLRWLHNSSNYTIKDLVINQSGHIVISLSNRRIRAITQENVLLWDVGFASSASGDTFAGLLSVSTKNEILFTDGLDKKLIAISDAGQLLWTYESSVVSRVLVFPDGRILMRSSNENHILSAQGQLLHKHPAGANSSWWDDGLITNNNYYLSGNMLIEPTSGQRTQVFNQRNESPITLTPNGLLVFTHSNSKELVALGLGGALPTAGWPTANLNIANNPSKAPPAKPFYQELAVDINMAGSVAVDGENVYAVSRTGSLIKYNKTGGVIWQRHHANRQGQLAPLTEHNAINLLLQSGQTGQVLNYNATGQLRWSHDLASSPSAAVLGPDSLLYVATSTGWLYAYLPDGNLAWQKKITSGASNGVSAMLHNGNTLLLTDSLGGLYQINPDGSVERYQQFASKILFTPVVTHTQQLVLAFADELILLTENWQPSWRLPLQAVVVSQPTLTPAGDIIIQQANATVSKRALSNGLPLWQYQMSGNSEHAAVHALDGSVYVAAQDWTLYQLNSHDGKLTKRINLAEAPRSAPAIKTRITAGSHPELLLIATADQKLKWIEIADARLALSGWPKAGQGLGNRSSLEYEGALRYASDFTAAVSTKVLHNESGNWFVASEDGQVAAMDSQGQLRWRFDTGSYLTASMALSTTGHLFVANTSGMLLALNDSGQPAWQMPLGQAVTTGIALDASNNLYLGTEQGIVSSITSSGQQRWQHNLGSAINAVPIVEQDWGSIFVISQTGVLKRLALNSGETLFEKQSCEPVLGSSLSVTDDGFISVQCAEHTVFYDFALNVRNQFSRDNISLTTVPLLSSSPTEKNYLFSDLSGAIHSISPEHQEQWRLQLSDPVGAATLIDSSNGIIYVATFEGDVVALSFSGQILWWQSVGSRIRAPLTLNDNNLIVAADNGKVHFIRVKPPVTAVHQAGADQRNSHNIQSLQNGVLLFDDGYDNQVVSEAALASASYNSQGHKIVNFNGGIRSFDLSGALLWSFITDNAQPVNAGIAVNSNDINLFGDNGGKLYAVAPTGQLVWKTQLAAPIKHSVAILSAELAAVTYGATNGQVAIFNMLTGQLLHQLAGDGQAVAAQNGGLLVTQGKLLRKYNAAGQTEWQTRFDEIDFGITYLAVFAVGSPVPADNGDIFINVVLDNSTGASSVLYTLLVRLNAMGEYISHSDPMLDNFYSQMAYDAKRQRLLMPLAYSAANIDVAQASIGTTHTLELSIGPVLAAPLLDDTGSIYLSASNGDVVAYNTEGQVLWQHKLAKPMVANSFSLTPNGFLAIGPYYLKTAASGDIVRLAEGWAKYAGNAGNANYLNLPYPQPEIALDIADNLDVRISRIATANGDMVTFTFAITDGYRLSRNVETNCGSGYWQSSHIYVLTAVTTNCSIAFSSNRKPKRKKLPIWLLLE